MNKPVLYDVFISKADEDNEKVHAIQHFMESKGIRCFCPQNHSAPPELEDDIIKTIDSSSVFLLIFSENSAKADYVANELMLAVKHERYIIPFMIDNSKPDGDMGLLLSTINWVDGTREPFDERICELTTSILNILYPKPQWKKYLTIGLITLVILAAVFIPLALNSGNVNQPGMDDYNKAMNLIYLDKWDEAIPYLLLSAEAGYTKSMNRLGECYEKGSGTEINPTEAFVWYQKAAETGNAEGMRNLGKCYVLGIGTDIDFTKSFEWSLKAAEKGDAPSMFTTGIYYYSGLGTEVNYTKALEWWTKASDAGEVTSTALLEFIGAGGTEIDYNKVDEFIKTE